MRPSWWRTPGVRTLRYMVELQLGFFHFDDVCGPHVEGGEVLHFKKEERDKSVIMRLSQAIIAIAVSAALVPSAGAFSRPSLPFAQPRTCSLKATTDVAPAMASSGVPPAHSDASEANVAEAEIPTNLPSAVGKDYVPLATMLATGELAEADQVRTVQPLMCLVSQKLQRLNSFSIFNSSPEMH